MDDVVSRDEFAGRCQVEDERFARDKKDIEELDKQMQEISKLTIQISELVKQNNALLEKHECRITAIESRPSDWLDRIIAAAIGAAVAALVGAAMNIWR